MSTELTSTTAPGKVFASRQELADHYKSDWHKYNLKRREAGLPLLLKADFQARLAAAMSLRQDDQRQGTSHLKKGKPQKNKKQNNKHQQKNNKEDGGIVAKSQAAAYDAVKNNSVAADADDDANSDDETHPTTVQMETEQDYEEAEEGKEEDTVMIDPKQCLFDRHMSATVEANAERMYRKYGLFIPDREYLSDLEGLVGYCHEKIKLGHMCLYCHKVFPTWQGCQKHMISKRHTKLRYEAGIDLEDLAVFYDFAEADAEFLSSVRHGAVPDNNENKEMEEDDVVVEDDGNDEDWEDVSDDEDMADASNDDDEEGDDEELYDAYQEGLAQFGFDVTELGELVLPDGRIVGHRALSRYYKQRVPQRNSNSTAVEAARHAAGDRLYRGQVYNLNQLANVTTTDTAALALAKAGIAPGRAAGRSGNGLLVKSSGVYTAVSIYRYRAALRKQHRGDMKGKRIHEKSKQNMNKMDKKHNRLMNGVSVAHAAR